MACMRFLLGKDRICHTARDKDGNHRVESVFPPKVKPAISMMVPFTKKEILPTFLPVFLRIVRLTIIRPTTGDIVSKSKTNPQAHDTPPKKGIDNRILRQGRHRHKLDKEGTHGYRDEGKDGELMPNLIPSQDHQRKLMA